LALTSQKELTSHKFSLSNFLSI